MIVFLKKASLDGKIYEKNEVLWAIYEHEGNHPFLPPEPVLIGAATTRLLPKIKAAEISLAGGIKGRSWIGMLDKMVGEWAILEGAEKLIVLGRKGWKRMQKNWVVIGEKNGIIEYHRNLKNEHKNKE